MLIFRQLFDPQSSTYSYLLGDSATGDAILIDPVFEQAARDAALIKELGLKLITTLDTHVHADHVTGAWLLKKRLGGKIAVSAASGAEGADMRLADGDRIGFGGRHITALATLPISDYASAGRFSASIRIWSKGTALAAAWITMAASSNHSRRHNRDADFFTTTGKPAYRWQQRLEPL